MRNQAGRAESAAAPPEAPDTLTSSADRLGFHVYCIADLRSCALQYVFELLCIACAIWQKAEGLFKQRRASLIGCLRRFAFCQRQMDLSRWQKFCQDEAV